MEKTTPVNLAISVLTSTTTFAFFRAFQSAHESGMLQQHIYVIH